MSTIPLYAHRYIAIETHAGLKSLLTSWSSMTVVQHVNKYASSLPNAAQQAVLEHHTLKTRPTCVAAHVERRAVNTTDTLVSQRGPGLTTSQGL